MKLEPEQPNLSLLSSSSSCKRGCTQTLFRGANTTHAFRQYVQGWCCSLTCLRNWIDIHSLRYLGKSGYGDVICPGISNVYDDSDTYILPENLNFTVCLNCSAESQQKQTYYCQTIVKLISSSKQAPANECFVVQLSTPITQERYNEVTEKDVRFCLVHLDFMHNIPFEEEKEEQTSIDPFEED
jgi:hypothetical protein